MKCSILFNYKRIKVWHKHTNISVVNSFYTYIIYVCKSYELIFKGTIESTMNHELSHILYIKLFLYLTVRIICASLLFESRPLLSKCLTLQVRYQIRWYNYTLITPQCEITLDFFFIIRTTLYIVRVFANIERWIVLSKP